MSPAPSDKPLVSIIVICFNQELYIEKAVRSCICQTYENIEIIVSDDASVDGTVEKIVGLCAIDSRIKLITASRNRGITGNVQAALANCHGKYIAFLGGDDFLYPDKIALQVACMECDLEIALSFTQCDVVNEEGATSLRVTASAKHSDVVDGYQLAARFGVEIPGPAPMVRSSCVPLEGFRSFSSVASDWLFFIETTCDKRVKLIKIPLAAYRIHSCNVGKRRYEYISDYVSSYRFLEKNYGNNRRLVQCAKTGLRRYLLGTCYASVVEFNNSATNEVLSRYKEIYGVFSIYLLLKVVTVLRFGKFFGLLRPLIKKILVL